MVSDYDLEESAPLFQGGSPKNSLQSDIFVGVLNIYKADDCGLLMPEVSSFLSAGKIMIPLKILESPLVPHDLLQTQ